MFQEFYKSSQWLSLPLITLVFFLLFFVAMLVWVVFGLRDKRRVDHLASLPFASDREPQKQPESNHG